MIIKFSYEVAMNDIKEVQLKRKLSLCGQGPAKAPKDPKDGVVSRGWLATLVTQSREICRQRLSFT